MGLVYVSHLNSKKQLLVSYFASGRSKEVRNLPLLPYLEGLAPHPHPPCVVCGVGSYCGVFSIWAKGMVWNRPSPEPISSGGTVLRKKNRKDHS